MTNKIQKIKEEIEKRLSLLWDLIPESEKVLKDDFTKDDANNLGKYTALESLLQFIDSLPEEPKSEDLEEEMIRWHKEHFDNKRDWGKTSGEYLERKSQLDIAHHFAEWQKQKDLEDSLKSDMTMPNKFYEKGKADAMIEMKETLQTEYEKGRFDMMEEMMKDAVDGEICGEWRNQEDEPYELYAESYEIDNSKFKIGDKVKIIICKTEQQ